MERRSRRQRATLGDLLLFLYIPKRRPPDISSASGRDPLERTMVVNILGYILVLGIRELHTYVQLVVVWVDIYRRKMRRTFRMPYTV